MIVRDNYAIIVQHYPETPNQGDGGDSSRTTGIMALFGSRIDQIIIETHWTSKGFVRHPKQHGWDNPRIFSRDQLVCLSAGLWKSKKDWIVKHEFYRQYWKGVCPNVDLIIDPCFYWHLILCGRIKWLYPLAPIGYLFLLIHILFMTKIRPDAEQNQTICMAAVAGTFFLDLWCFLHPDWIGSLFDYWNGWRDQGEIASHIEESISKN